MPTSDWSLIAREVQEPMITTGKANDSSHNVTSWCTRRKLDCWSHIDWRKATKRVRRLQLRIAKAYREGRYNRVKSLQYLLTHSLSAKLLAVKRVAENKGGKTPGVDGVTWKTAKQKWRAALDLKQRSYRVQPLRRIYIPKRTGKLRPLSIPTMHCRFMQALHLLALEPIAEMITDKHTYGFRTLRSTADANEQCFIALARKNGAPYVLEADIQSCFDRIDKTWLLNNIPMDKKILKQWLEAGYVEKYQWYPTNDGTPQGAIISPTLLNITLSGLEAVAKQAANPKDKVNVCVYADDFIITGATKAVLEQKVRPAVERFLKERGLNLSLEKTHITHISEGFDFLGVNHRKYNGKFIQRPAKDNQTRFLRDIRTLIKANKSAKTEKLIQILNSKIRGWANYHRSICAKRAFNYVDAQIYQALWFWAKRRHPNKGGKWLRKKYFRSHGMKRWIFSTKCIDKEGNKVFLDLISAAKIPIKRHVKIRAEATPFDPQYHEYLSHRMLSKQRSKQVSCKQPDWQHCWWELFSKPQAESPNGA